MKHRETEVRSVEELQRVPLYPKIKSMEVDQDRHEPVVRLEERDGGIGRTNFFINNKEILPDANPARKTEFSIDLSLHSNYFIESKFNFFI